MNKKLLKALFLVSQISLMTACSSLIPSSSNSVESSSTKEPDPNYAYENIATKAPDAEYKFESTLEAAKPIYPLSNGRVFYVSNLGSDDNDGLSENSPIKSLSKINTLVLQPGDSVLFRKGDTFTGTINLNELAGEDDNPITFSSYGEGNMPILTSASTVMHFEKCSNVVVRDLHVKVVGVDRLNAPGDCRVGIEFSYDYVKEKYRNVYICNNKVEGDSVSSNIMGIVVDGLESNYATTPSEVLSNCYVNGNEVFNMGRSGIHAGGWMANEKINQNQGRLDYFKNFFFDNNIVHHVGTIGVYIVACTNSTMNRNLVYQTGIYDQNQVMEGECGIMALSTKDCEIMFNECYDMYDQKTGYDAMGIDIDWNTDNVKVQYNYLHNCQGGGIGTMANQNSFVLNNRIEKSKAQTNHPGSIVVTNFTSRYSAVREDWHAVKNLKIADNLVIHDVDDKSLFVVKNSNGDIDFKGNSFERNHCIYTGDEVSTFKWVNVDPDLPWYKFAENKWYSKDTSKFSCFEMTEYVDINYEDGAMPYERAAKKNFEDWAKRDMGATYETISDEVGANPKNATVTYENGELKFNWEVNEGDIWHYNIYEVGENEEVEYRNMIGEAFETNFTYKPKTSGTRYYVIQPESNQGVHGRALKIKVEL